MQNNATNKLYSMKEAIPMAKRMLDIDINEFDLAEVADYVLKECGSFDIGDFLLRKQKIKNGKIDPNCDMYAIKWVTTTKPFDWYKKLAPIEGVDNILVNYSLPVITLYPSTSVVNQTSIASILLSIDDTFIYQSQGAFIPYVFHTDGCLHFNNEFENLEVDIVYTHPIIDHDGFPFIKENVAIALVYYINYLQIQKKYFCKQCPEDVFLTAERLMERYIAQARVPIKVSDNEWDRFLNVMINTNRKQTNNPFRQP